MNAKTARGASMPRIPNLTKEVDEIRALTTTPKSRRFLRGLIKWFDPKTEQASIVLILREAKEAGLI